MPTDGTSQHRSWHRTPAQRALVLTVVLTVCIGIAAPGEAYRRPGHTERASVAPRGAQGIALPTDMVSGCDPRVALSDITPDGRYIAFASGASNLVPGDTNNACDVFVRDRKRGTTKRVSVSSAGVQTMVGGDSCKDAVHPSGHTPFPHSYLPSISANGRYVAFASRATDLVDGDTNNDEDVFVHDVSTGITTRVSVASDGSQATGNYLQGQLSCALSKMPSISGNGRYVAFSSFAHNLTKTDGNAHEDVYVHDRNTRKTIVASVDWRGRQPATGDNLYPSLNHNGRYLVFESRAQLTQDQRPDLGSQQVYRRDLRKKKTVIASVSSHGEIGCCGDTRTWGLGGRQISASGRFVTFVSNAINLVPNDTPQDADLVARSSGSDIFVHDFHTGKTERVSVNSFGEEASDGISPSMQSGSISANGRYVVFTAGASRQLYPDERPGSRLNAFIYDRLTGTLEWISATPAGTQSTEDCETADVTGLGFPLLALSGLRLVDLAGSHASSVDDSGRFVAFDSCAGDLVAGDTNEIWDTLVRDRGPDHGAGTGGSGEDPDPPVMCIDDVCIPPQTGQHAEDRSGDTAVDVEGGDITGFSVAYRPNTDDLYLKIATSSMPRRIAGLAAARPLLYGATFTVGGVRYQVRAQAVPGPDYTVDGGASFGLFRQVAASAVWTRVTALRGGYGTTGDAVVVSVPLRAIPGLQRNVVPRVSAFTGVGTYETGPALTVDTAALK